MLFFENKPKPEGETRAKSRPELASFRLGIIDSTIPALSLSRNLINLITTPPTYIVDHTPNPKRQNTYKTINYYHITYHYHSAGLV